MNMKTMMMIAGLVSLVSGCATVGNHGRLIAARGSLSALVQPNDDAQPSYTGIERVSSSFRDGAHGHAR
jgi:hypothetical protein